VKTSRAPPLVKSSRAAFPLGKTRVVGGKSSAGFHQGFALVKYKEIRGGREWCPFRVLRRFPPGENQGGPPPGLVFPGVPKNMWLFIIKNKIDLSIAAMGFTPRLILRLRGSGAQKIAFPQAITQVSTLSFTRFCRFSPGSCPGFPLGEVAANAGFPQGKTGFPQGKTRGIPVGARIGRGDLRARRPATTRVFPWGSPGLLSFTLVCFLGNARFPGPGQPG
jgi:hypothetical protein